MSMKPMSWHLPPPFNEPLSKFVPTARKEPLRTFVAANQ